MDMLSCISMCVSSGARTPYSFRAAKFTQSLVEQELLTLSEQTSSLNL